MIPSVLGFAGGVSLLSSFVSGCEYGRCSAYGANPGSLVGLEGFS